jgi:hypothetical protein
LAGNAGSCALDVLLVCKFFQIYSAGIFRLYFGINIFLSPENLRITTASVSSPSVSAGFSINRQRLELLNAKPAPTLGLLTPF